MKRKYKIIISIALVLAIMVYAAASYLSPLPVWTEQVRAGDINDIFTVQGQVVPQESMLLNSTATGTITSLPYKPGMEVKSGQELVRITASDPTELAMQKEQLRQQLATAEYQYRQLFGEPGQARQRAALEAAQSAYDLAEQQYQAALAVESQMSGVYTEAELAELANAVKAARQALTAAEAQGAAPSDRDYYQTLMDSTRAQLAALEEEQQNEPLLAPFDGVVWQILTEQGAYIIKRQPLLKLYQQGQMKVEVSLLSEDSLGLQVNQSVTLRLSDGSIYQANISFISPVAEQVISSLGIAENRCTVELEAQELPPELGAGYQVDVIFTRLMAQNVLSVAASSIVPISEGSAVYVVEQGRARLVSVATAAKSGGRVEIISGLQEGDAVISDPYDAGIKDGGRVKVMND